MEKTIQETLTLLVVGMTTVALVLGLVVLAGRLLISYVNRSSAKSPAPRPAVAPPNAEDRLDPKIIAVLNATVEHITHGQGKINTIESYKAK